MCVCVGLLTLRQPTTDSRSLLELNAILFEERSETLRDIQDEN